MSVSPYLYPPALLHSQPSQSQTLIPDLTPNLLGGGGTTTNSDTNYVSYPGTTGSSSAPSTPRPTNVHSRLNPFSTCSSPRKGNRPSNTATSNDNRPYQHQPYPSLRSNTKESKRRQDLAIRVVTQPTPQMNPGGGKTTVVPAGRVIRQRLLPLPETWTELLMRLYETVIQAKNCEIPVDIFWNMYDSSSNSFLSRPYTRQSIEHTLSTIGVECSTQSHGKQVSTGRWLLLRHGHFLLRSQHTITWVEVPQGQIGPSEGSATGNQAEYAPIVWDWRSGAEKWRWHTWLESFYMRYTPDGQFEVVRSAADSMDEDEAGDEERQGEDDIML